MGYRIVADSCTDLTDSLRKDENVVIIPLTLEVGGYQIIDDETFDQQDFIKRVHECPQCPKSSCPSPEAYMNAFKGEDDIYVVTLSSNLSGSFNSAVLAKKLYEEENDPKNILIIDSCSASVGQTLIALKLKEFLQKGYAFEEVKNRILKFRDEMNTMFVIESLETLRKNGRLSNLQAMICNALNIKPVMGATPEGTIYKIDQARGMNKSIQLMAGIIKKGEPHPEQKILGIAHCNNYERALYTKEEILKENPFIECVIVDTAGVSSMYANNGGIVVAY